VGFSQNWSLDVRHVPPSSALPLVDPRHRARRLSVLSGSVWSKAEETGGVMPGTYRLTLGAEVECTDGNCGVVRALVVDPAGPAGPRVTHLVVEPEGRIGLGRLVPIELVASAEAVVRLTCDVAALSSFPRAETTEVVRDLGAGYVFLHSEVLLRPEVHDVLPPGETGLREATPVRATDGAIGAAGGLIVRPDDHAITSVMVSEERLLWGHKTLAVPIGVVASFDDGIQLNLATDAVGQVAEGVHP
jgi:hypothetical protein